MNKASIGRGELFALWGLTDDAAPLGDAAHLDGDAAAATTNARIMMAALRDGRGERSAVLASLRELADRFAFLSECAERAGRDKLAADLVSWFVGLSDLVANAGE